MSWVYAVVLMFMFGCSPDVTDKKKREERARKLASAFGQVEAFVCSHPSRTCKNEHSTSCMVRIKTANAELFLSFKCSNSSCKVVSSTSTRIKVNDR